MKTRLATLWAAPAVAIAAAPPLPDPALPSPGADAVVASASMARGLVPPFQASPRDQTALGLTAHWAPAPAVAFRLHYAWLSARWPDGGARAGTGDLRLGASGRIWDPAAGGVAPRWVPAIWLDSETKLPNAADRDDEVSGVGEDAVPGLGTDETDVRVGGVATWALEPLSVRLGAGLLILGNPLMFANQDDAAWLAGSASYALGQVAPFVRGGGRLASPRNPADLSAGGGAALSPGPWRLGLEVRAGLTPAAADWSAGAWAGWSWTCRNCPDD